MRKLMYNTPMSIYGKSPKPKSIEVKKDKLPKDDREEIFTPFTELCKFADEYKLHVEIEKPFQEFPNLFLKVVDKKGDEVKKETLDDIDSIDDVAGKMLNQLSRKAKNAKPKLSRD